MTRLPDDPRLTAFALGELGADEAREIEAILAGDPEALALVAEVRATGLLVAEHLQAEPAPGLAPEDRRAIDAWIESIPSVFQPASRRRWGRWAIAAGLVGLAATLLFPSMRDSLRPEPARALAASTPPATPAPVAIAPPADSMQLAAKPALPGLREAAPMPSNAAALADRRDVGRKLSEPEAFNLVSRSKADAGPAGPSTPAAFDREEAQSLVKAGRARRTSDELLARSRNLSAASKPSANAPNQLLGPVSPPVASEPTSFGFRADQDAGLKQSLEPAQRVADLGVKDVARDKPPAPTGKSEIKLKQPPAETPPGGDAFALVTDNPFRPVSVDEPSTFSIDCDTASYSSVRKFLNRGVRPPGDAVRIEELINYFTYAYAKPRGDDPFSIDVEVARCPWDAAHRLVRVGLMGREVEKDRRPASNLVFLIDVSGSMDELDKLPLLRAGMKLMVGALGENDRVAIVVYANTEGIALDSTSCARKAEILSSLDQLRARGGTDGGKGITLAYDLAVRNFVPGGTNRVILATDGDFNIGVTDEAELDRLIEAKRATGVFLSVLGFGEGNVKHDRLERLADRGNGQYCFIDSINEARKVLVDQMGGTLLTIAKDVKIQVKFNPDRASSYRLIGYENRQLQARDFADDRKDAGEIGAGHTVTALYEVVPPGQVGAALALNRPAQVQATAKPAGLGWSGLLEVDVRCKAPDGDVSRLLRCQADDVGRDFGAASPDFRFASAVAGFGMLLRDSPYKGSLTWPGLIELTIGSIGPDIAGYRKEFLELVRKAQEAPAR